MNERLFSVQLNVDCYAREAREKKMPRWRTADVNNGRGMRVRQQEEDDESEENNCLYLYSQSSGNVWFALR